jgi:hypothetical protein
MPDFCRSCKAPIRWAITAETGSIMPLDAEPNPQGEWRLTSRDRGELPRAIHVAEDRRPGLQRELMMAHWATCPYADRHRRRR